MRLSPSPSRHHRRCQPASDRRSIPILLLFSSFLPSFLPPSCLLPLLLPQSPPSLSTTRGHVILWSATLSDPRSRPVIHSAQGRGSPCPIARELRPHDPPFPTVRARLPIAETDALRPPPPPPSSVVRRPSSVVSRRALSDKRTCPVETACGTWTSSYISLRDMYPDCWLAGWLAGCRLPLEMQAR